MKTAPKPTKKAATAKPAAATSTKKKTAAARAKKAPAKAAASAKRATATRKVPPRADYGKPIDGFFAKQPPHLRDVLHALRALVEDAAPEATSQLKWGMPFYSVGRAMMCALGGFKSHVNLILVGSPAEYPDPKGLLEGDATGGRRLKLRALSELPEAETRAWLRKAAALARKKSGAS
jgi:hypothetical protein